MSGMNDRDSWSTYESGPTLWHSSVLSRNLFQNVCQNENIYFDKFRQTLITHPDHMVFLLMRRFENLAPVGSVYVV